MAEGHFITFEGPDGSGKSTQVELTANYLRGRGLEVVCTREPGGTPESERIRQLVLDKEFDIHRRTETLLYLAARAEHVEKVIKPALHAGKIVICDRFTDSTMVYQGFVQGVAASKVAALSTFAADGLIPALTILLDADPEDLLERRVQRGVTDKFEAAGLDFQKKVRRGFELLANTNPLRIKKIDALQTQAAIQEQIQKLLWEAGIAE